MGGKLIDRHEMAQLVTLVIDKDVTIKNALKKFDFVHSAASKFVKQARDGVFDYQKYLNADTEPPPTPNNESDDRSIFAVAEMIDYAVTQALVDQMSEIKEILEVLGAKHRGFEESVKNKFEKMENRVNRHTRGMNPD